MKSIILHFTESIYKGYSEKKWESRDVTDISRGNGRVVVKGLQQGTLYRMYAVATNDCGDSPPSNELWFRTVDGDIEKRTT